MLIANIYRCKFISTRLHKVPDIFLVLEGMQKNQQQYHSFVDVREWYHTAINKRIGRIGHWECTKDIW
jgi:hypothetical protein